MAMKDKVGKPRVELVHYALIKAVAEIREFGINKYQNDEDWKKNTVEDYAAAAIRHIYKHLWEGKLDEESGKPHLYHAACSLDLALALTEIKEKALHELTSTSQDMGLYN